MDKKLIVILLSSLLYSLLGIILIASSEPTIGIFLLLPSAIGIFLTIAQRHSLKKSFLLALLTLSVLETIFGVTAFYVSFIMGMIFAGVPAAATICVFLLIKNITKQKEPKINQVTHRQNSMIDFVAIDFETTGLDPKTNNIIQAAAVKYVNGKEVDSYSSFANPHQYIIPRVTELTGITNEKVQDAPSADEVISQLIQFIGNKPIVAHNATFEVNFLQKYAPNYYPETYDTLTMSQAKNNLENHKLQTIKDYYGIDGQWHEALSDSRATAEIFIKLCSSSTKPLYAANINPSTNKHYIPITFESKVISNQKNEDLNIFDEEERSYIEYAKSLVPNIPLTATKSSFYVVLRCFEEELLRFKGSATLKYVLLPGTNEQYEHLNLEFGKPSKAEFGKVRLMINEPSDLQKFKFLLDEGNRVIENKIKMLDFTYQQLPQ